MSSTPLPVVTGRPSVVDGAGLRDALAEGVQGEVRFDRLSRALYASVYQIVPLGVVLPRTDAGVVATVNACARFGAPLMG